MKKFLFIKLFLLIILVLSCEASGGKDGAPGVPGRPGAWKSGDPIVEGNNIGGTLTKDLDDYGKVSLEGNFNLVLKSGTKNEIVLEGEENIIPYIVREIKDDELRIAYAVEKDGLPLWIKKINKKIKVTVSSTNLTLSGVKNTGSGDITGEDEIDTKTIAITSKGSGNIRLKLKAVEVNVNTDGSGKVALSGKAEKLTVISKGSGAVDAGKLESKNVEATTKGSGDINVKATKTLNAVIEGSGNIRYSGNPTNVEEKDSGSGELSKLTP